MLNMEHYAAQRKKEAEAFSDNRLRHWMVEESPDTVLAEFTEYFGVYAARDLMTEVAMNLSLCPIHLIDWAICFDDLTEGCEQVRAIFPNSHDT